MNSYNFKNISTLSQISELGKINFEIEFHVTIFGILPFLNLRLLAKNTSLYMDCKIVKIIVMN